MARMDLIIHVYGLFFDLLLSILVLPFEVRLFALSTKVMRKK